MSEKTIFWSIKIEFFTFFDIYEPFALDILLKNIATYAIRLKKFVTLRRLI